MRKTQKGMMLLALVAAVLAGCQKGMGDYGSLLGASDGSGSGEPVPAEWHLDVGIVHFQIPFDRDDVADGKVFPRVRQAEALHFPQQLRQAMLRGGGWRHVWVVPDRAVTDLRVMGTIVESDGTDLKLDILAVDATGQTWLERTYEHEFEEGDYAGEDRARPLDTLFGRIAKDLLEPRDRKGVTAMKQIRGVAELRFAKEFAPRAFARHVVEENGEFRLISLPAQEDSLYQLVLQVKERDDLFIETLQDYYGDFSDRIDSPYRDWARQSYYERKMHDEGVLSSVTQGVLSVLAIAAGIAIAADAKSPELRETGQILAGAGAYGAYDAYQDYQATEIHQEALRELGQSLDLAIEPQVVEVENQTRTLTGSVEEQYQQWQAILNEVYLAERGGSN